MSQAHEALEFGPRGSVSHDPTACQWARLCRAPCFLLRAPLLRRISVNVRGGDKAHFGHVRGSALHRLVAGVLEATRGPLFSAFLAEDRPAQSARLAARLAVLWLPSGDRGFSIAPPLLLLAGRGSDRPVMGLGLEIDPVRGGRQGGARRAARRTSCELDVEGIRQVLNLPAMKWSSEDVREVARTPIAPSVLLAVCNLSRVAG